MKRFLSLRSLIILVPLLLLIGVPFATFAKSATPAGGAAKQCSLATLKGTYVFNADGFQIVGSNQVPFALAGIATFDGQGNLQGFISQSANGTLLAHQVPFTGTYTVNSNCTGTETDTAGGNVVHFDNFITPNGSLVRFVQTDPGVVSTGVASQN